MEKARWLFFRARRELERAGRSIIHWNLGSPIPSGPSVVDAVRDAVAAGGIATYPRRPFPPCARRFRLFEADAAVGRGAGAVLVAPGCKMALSLAMMALIEPGDESALPRSGLSDLSFVHARSGRDNCAVWLEEKNGFQPDLDEIARKITRERPR